MPKPCASCLNFSIDKVVKSMDYMKPKWLENTDYVENFIHKTSNFSLKKSKKYDTNIELDLGLSMANKRILYWCAKSKENDSPIVADAKEAYGDFSNHGISLVNKDGKVKLFFDCPQLYNTIPKNGKYKHTYFRHLHFVVANSNCEKWLSQIYTKIIVCSYDLKEVLSMKSSGLYILLNTLPASNYAKDHIPGSYNLHHKSIANMSVRELRKWFSDIVELHYPKLQSYLKNEKIEIYELPIITYCAHEKCNASDLALKELMKKGFVNVSEFPGGMEDYREVYSSD